MALNNESYNPFNEQHRTWLVPNKPWMMKQTWNDLLFANWPISVTELKKIVPDALTIDTYEGEAWISIVPFQLSGARPRFMPSLPYLSNFPEINVRTYVTLQGKPGVYFFSLDADQHIIVELARLGLHLPYYHAEINVVTDSDQIIHYRSIRRDSRAKPGQFAASYRPVSKVRYSESDCLAYWLTERYCMYMTNSKGTIYRGEINHSPWPLQLAEANIETNTLFNSFGLSQPVNKPLLYYAEKLDVHAWLPYKCR